MRTGGANHTEWNARYQEFLTQAAARAKRNLDLYRDIVARVAAGALPPELLDSRMPAFLQTHGADYANDLAALSMRFLSGLIDNGTRYSYELFDRILPGAVEFPEIDPPEFDPTDWGDWFSQLTDYGNQQNLLVSEMVRSLMEQVAAGELVPAEVSETSTAFIGERMPDSVADMARLYLDLLSGLDEVNSDFGADYLESVLDAAAPSDGFVLEVAGSLGSTAAVRLAVANTLAETTSVRCVLTDLRRADGVGPAFEPEVTMTPERFDLAPEQEQVVTVALNLAEGTFDPGPVYVGTLHVLAPDETLLAVPVRVRARAGA